MVIYSTKVNASGESGGESGGVEVTGGVNMCERTYCGMLWNQRFMRGQWEGQARR